MLKKIFIGFSLLTFHLSIYAATIEHVIYVTLDGIRWQDILINDTYFKNFWQKYLTQAKIYGLPDSDLLIETASIAYSMPSYHSQMAGSVQPCRTNLCSRIKVETFPEHIKNILNLPLQDIAVFASWFRIDEAAEHISHTIFTNTGNSPMADPNTHLPDEAMQDLNAKQLADHPPLGLNRYDKYTFAQALHYFTTYKPRFMWISFNDADHAAHKKKLEEYHAALIFYDKALDELLSQLKNLNLMKNTLVIITTDHGRGDGDSWSEHGPFFPESKKTWAFVFNGELVAIPKDNHINYSTLSIRPTVEKAFNINV